MLTKLKKLLSIQGIIIIFLLLSYLSATYAWSKTKTLESITGFYQSVGYPVDLYEYSFDWETEGDYFFRLNGIVLEKGKFERYKDNIYVCTDESGNEKIITLLNEGFYFYYETDKKVVEMKRVSEIPSALPE
ncbi:hypothetical protein [Sedimentibacter sp.]|uniref:hypothetical protein n=1 Tax=Sedimentibacter sp. TaxID=1960295 RepID=UPI00289BF0A2|nr:hypothetical protein [Sedimentibacter sp.]